MALTHINAVGEATMVDVGHKPSTARMARAYGRINMQPQTLAAILSHTLKKGDVLAVARVAGIMAAKRTSALIPLCHGLALSSVSVDFQPFGEQAGAATSGFHCLGEAHTHGQTGVEMEALTAVSVALLTLYDMGKAIDRFMSIEGMAMVEKQGGKSGHWVNPHLSAWASGQH